MKIKVKVYGPVKDAIGRNSLEVEIPAGGVIKDLLTRIISDYPGVAYKNSEGITASHIFLRCSHIVEPDQILTEGDEINIFPYIEGG